MGRISTFFSAFFGTKNENNETNGTNEIEEIKENKEKILKEYGDEKLRRDTSAEREFEGRNSHNQTGVRAKVKASQKSGTRNGKELKNTEPDREER